jgi:hypothetical protein
VSASASSSASGRTCMTACASIWPPSAARPGCWRMICRAQEAVRGAGRGHDRGVHPAGGAGGAQSGARHFPCACGPQRPRGGTFRSGTGDQPSHGREHRWSRTASDVHLENPESSMHLYRIAQEAVANAVRHGQAREIVITLNLAARKPGTANRRRWRRHACPKKKTAEAWGCAPCVTAPRFCGPGLKRPTPRERRHFGDLLLPVPPTPP